MSSPENMVLTIQTRLDVDIDFNFLYVIYKNVVTSIGEEKNDQKGMTHGENGQS